MKTFVKAALGALVLAPLALSGATTAQARVDLGINLGVPVGPPVYADPCYDPRIGGPDPACVYPYYEGPVFFSGTWYNGPIRYRDFRGHREFWIHGGWHQGRMGHR
jgi:hypothetical protein